ncbi:acyl carrier protein [Nocardia vulneris]|uniref:Carrier domain-containing protein n=1 Tax=Nocardia vulneris TaxID=1141657 RepID=A0ABR4ZA21_9NOCA|nr:phosphopantetheine-binding protein [Nocardia vulneris]KIA62175.1 hypothetical protein FG87_26655 [Nocardia vulneris]
MKPADLAEILTRALNPGGGPPSLVVRLPEEALDLTMKELNIDSLAQIEMIDAINRHYRIAISDAEADALHTPRQVLDFVAVKLSKRR